MLFDNEISYPIVSTPMLYGGESNDFHLQKDNMTMVINVKSNQGSITVKMNEEATRKFAENYNYPSRKEKFYLTAINNLLKKTEFLQLSLQHLEQSITDEEYENELEHSPEKYFIDLNNNINQNELFLITEIINKVGKSFSLDEVSEIFSITPKCLKSSLVNK